MRTNSENLIDAFGTLHAICNKVRSLSEIFSMAKGDPPFSEEGLCGFSYLLEDIANDLDDVKDQFEKEKQPK